MLGKLKSTSLTEFTSTDLSLLLLRFFAASFMLYGHGFDKLMNVLSGNLQFGDPIGLGPEISLILVAFAEGICTILIILGFYTRFAAIVLMIDMAVAFLFVHLTQSFGDMELPLLYLLLFTSVFLLGPGKLSIDGNSRR